MTPVFDVTITGIVGDSMGVDGAKEGDLVAISIVPSEDRADVWITIRDGIPGDQRMGDMLCLPVTVNLDRLLGALVASGALRLVGEDGWRKVGP